MSDLGKTVPAASGAGPEHEDAGPWAPEIAEIGRRKAWAKELGGTESVKRQHDLGKLTARERIDVLLDPASFREIGTLTGSVEYDDADVATSMVPSNSVIGQGRVAGRRLMVAADDYTVRGGSSEASVSEKWIFAERWALENRVPLVRLVDAAGGSVRILEKAGSTKVPGYSTWAPTALLSTVPVVGVALGPCAGLGAGKVALSHFSVMVEGTSQVFAGGPHVVAPGIGQVIDKESLGGSKVHGRGSGVVDNVAADEQAAMSQVRTFLSYLPSSVHHLPPVQPATDTRGRVEALNSIIPRERRTVYDARKLLRLVLDEDSLFEIGRFWGRSMISVLGRIGGRPVGVMIGDPRHLGGGVSAAAADKMTRFIDMCENFHLPLVNFVDQPGVYVGRQAEESGTIRHALRLMCTIEQVQVPWSTVLIRRAFGIGGGLHSPTSSATIKYAWPSGRWGSIPVEGGVEAAFRREISESEDPEARRAELVAHYERFESPFRTAERFGVQEMIEPASTRELLQEWVEDAYHVLPEHLGSLERTFRV